MNAMTFCILKMLLYVKMKQLSNENNLEEVLCGDLVD